MMVKQLQLIKKEESIIKDDLFCAQKGFSLIEVLIASSICLLITVSLAGVFFYGEEAATLAYQRTQASLLAKEGLDAVQNLRDADFSNLVDGTYGLAVVNNKWTFSGSSDVHDIFTREVTISTIDENTKQVSSKITWQQNSRRTGEIQLDTYLTNWQKIDEVEE